MANKRAKIIIYLISLSSVTAILAYVLSKVSPGEPRYHGKNLSFWLSRVHEVGLSAAEQWETGIAINRIGTNNIVLLLKWFQELEPPYERDDPYSEPWYHRWFEDMMTKQRLIKFAPTPVRNNVRLSRPTMAFRLFSEFPSVAKLAIPAFGSMLTGTNYTVKVKAALVLGNIGRDAIPVVLPVLSSENPTNRCLAAYVIGNSGPDGVELIPKLEALLNDDHPYPRLSAADALLKLNANPHTFVPILLKCLREGDDHAKWSASDILARLTNTPDLVVPGLLELFGSTTNQLDKRLIYRALNSLDSEAAAKVKKTDPRLTP